MLPYAVVALSLLGVQDPPAEEPRGEVVAEIQGEEIEYSEKEEEPAEEEAGREVARPAAPAVGYPSPAGHAGLIRTMSAGSSGPMGWSVGFTSSFFAMKGFLYTDDVEDTHGQYAGRLHASFTPVRFLELFLSLEFRVDSTDLEIQDPQTYRRLGNGLVGVRGILPIADLYTLSVSVAPRFYVKVDDLPFQWDATSVTLMAAQTFDLGARTRLPLRIHLNIGWDFDNTQKLVEKREEELSEEAGATRYVMRFERFVLDVSRVDHLLLGVALELATPWVGPFVEWTWDVPVARRDFSCLPPGTTAFPDDDSCLVAEGYEAFHMNLVLGLRLHPVPVPGLAFLVAVDVGLTGARAHVRELPANPPYAIYLGVSYSRKAKS